MSIDINNVIRTTSATVVGLILAVPMGFNIIQTGAQTRESLKPGPVQEYMTEIRENLVHACVDFNISPVDSKLEREAKNTIDDFFEGDKVNYQSICKSVLN